MTIRQLMGKARLASALNLLDHCMSYSKLKELETAMYQFDTN